MASMFGVKERLYADSRKGDMPNTAEAAVRQETPRAPVPAPAEQVESRPRAVAGVVSTGLEIAGIAALSCGGFLVAPWLGCMILGVLLIVLGVAVGYGA